MNFLLFRYILFALLSGCMSLLADTIAINFANSDFYGNTGIQQPTENTASLDDVAGLVDPQWTNLAVRGAGAWSTAEATVDGVQIAFYASSPYQGGGEMVSESGDASQQVFRVYLDDQDGKDYQEDDGYGVSVALTGLGELLSREKAVSYRLSLFLATGQDGFVVPELRKGRLTGTNRIVELSLLGTFLESELIGDGTYPSNLPLRKGDEPGTRAVFELSGLVDDSVVIAIPARSGKMRRGGLAGFAITFIQECLID